MSGIDTTYNSCVLYMQRERESLQLSIDKNQLQGQYASFNDSARSQEQSKQQDYGQENSYVISWWFRIQISRPFIPIFGASE